jgi:hypothetical protein
LLVTQPAPIVPVTVEPAAAVEPEPKVVTYAQLLEKVRDESELSAQEMDELRRVGQVGPWQVEGQCPPLPTHLIFAMFVGEDGDRQGDDHMPGDVRVYVRPKSMVQSDGELAPFFRCVINRGPNTALRIDPMPIKAWIEDVAYEFAQSVIEEDGDEDEEDDETELTPITCKAMVPVLSAPGQPPATAPCGAALDADAVYCHRCAAPVQVCKNCNHRAEIFDRFCAGCGIPLLTSA